MVGHHAQVCEHEGFEPDGSFEAALPMQVWAVDLEVERQRAISAAELAVLRLIECGVGDLDALTAGLGLGKDVRLVESVLVKLLGGGAIEPKGDVFTLTEIGAQWKDQGRMSQRERVTFDLRLDPTRAAFEWVGDERPAHSQVATWTIELPSPGDEEVHRRKHEVGKLVREDGLPDDEDKAPADRRQSVDLLSIALLSRRIHWRAVRVDRWRHRERGEVKLIGHIGEAEHPQLTEILAGFEVVERHRRIRRPLKEV